MTVSLPQIAAALSLACGVTVVAQIDPHGKSDASQPAGASFMQEMDSAMKTMDRDMANAPMNGNADHDFVTMMIPHHQGAIAMAKGELKYGQDPAIRRLAQEILADQQSEIDLMNLWLSKHAGPAAEAKTK